MDVSTGIPPTDGESPPAVADSPPANYITPTGAAAAAVRSVLERLWAAAAAGEWGAQERLWAPPGGTDAPPPVGSAQTLGGVTADFYPPALRRPLLGGQGPVAADVYVLGDQAWALAVEPGRSAAGLDGGGGALAAIYHLSRQDEAWRLTARIAIDHLAPGDPPGPQPGAGERGQIEAVRAVVEQFYAAYSRGEAEAADALWVAEPWAFQAILVPDARAGATGEPVALATLGFPAIPRAQRVLWRAAPGLVAPAGFQVWVLGQVAWVLAGERPAGRGGVTPGGTARTGCAVHRLILDADGGWRLAARIQVTGLSVPPTAAEEAAHRPQPAETHPAVASGPRAGLTPPDITGRREHHRPASGEIRWAVPRGAVASLRAAVDGALAAAARGAARQSAMLAALAGAAVTLAAAGQSAFLGRPPDLAGGLSLFVLGIAALSLGAALAGLDRAPRRREGAAPAPGAAAHRPPRTATRGGWRSAALLVAGVQALLLRRFLAGAPATADYRVAFLLWLGAIALYLVAIAPAGRPRLNLHTWWRRPATRVLVAVLGSIVLVALGMRVWNLGGIPPTLGGDEGSQGLEALRILKGELRNPFTTGWLGVPTMSFFFNTPTIAWLGNTIFALRLPWALVGTATVLVVFWLVTRLHGLALGLMTAGMLATYHYHIHFSRLGSNQIADPLFVALALLFLYRGCDRRSPLDWALCGVVVGVAQYSYAGARYTAVIVAAVILLFAVRDRGRFWREHGRGALVMLGAALLTAAPMIQFALRSPNDYNTRLNQVGIIQSGWLARETQLRHQGALPILLDQVQRAGLAFNAYPDRTAWYGSPKPLFDFAPAALFLLGLGYATLRLADRRLFPMVAWWWGAVLLGGALTESPPSSMRLITLAPPAVFFVALAVLRLAQLVQRALGGHDVRRLTLFLGAAVLAFGTGSVRWYFAEYTPLLVYGNPNAVVATALGKYARQSLGPGWRIYFFGPPRMHVGFGSIPFLAPDVEGVDVAQPLTAPPPPNLAPPDKDAAFVFLPDRRRELDLVRQTFPGGELEEVPSPLSRDPLYILYRVRRTGRTAIPAGS
ncbi:MAG: glycosyltransferase family 39 protein [Chloroflexi bacterium]|nr:glycosyltransferase family 39 protein [Chloroflexota bacterium]